MKLISYALLILCLQAICSEKDILNNPALTPVSYATFPNHDRVALVIDGEALCAIVADLEVEKSAPVERRSVTKAVKVLQDAFKQCAGVDLKVLSPDAPEIEDYRVVISLGDNEITRKMGVDTTKLPKQGFTVRVTQKVIIIAGYDGSFIPDSHTIYDWPRIRYNGTLNGAYDFVERILGVRYYFPGIGTIYPKHRSVVMNSMFYSDEPRFINRFSHVIAHAQNRSNYYPEMDATENEDWEARYRLARGDGFWAGQAPAVEFLDKKYQNKLDTIHYRDISGHLYYNPKDHIGNYMDTSNLDLVDILIDELHKHYKSNGRDQSVWMNFQANQTHVTFGQCYTTLHGMDNATIRQLNLIPDSIRNNPLCELSNVHARFTFHLARKLNDAYPGRRLIVTPYGNYYLPPTMKEYQKFPENIDICLTLASMPAMAANEDDLNKCRDLMHDYYDMLSRRRVAAIWTFNPNQRHNRWARALSGRYLSKVATSMEPFLGNEELIFDYNGSHEWELFYNYYLVWRSLWNPDFDVDAALEEMWSLLYGDAAPHIREFYNTVVAQYESSVRGVELEKAFSAEVLKKLEDCLQEAEKAVDSTSLEAKRLVLFRRYWDRTFIEAKALIAFKRPEYKIKFSEIKPTIDGIEDDVWKNAMEFHLNDAPFSPNPGKCPSSMRMLNCGDGVYVLVKSQGKPLANKDNAVWNNCCLEIKVKRNAEEDGYFHFAFGAYGQHYSGQSTNVTLLENIVVNKHSKCLNVSNTDDGNWLMECFIPWSEMGGMPTNGESTLLGNVVISRIQPQKCIRSFSLTFGKDDDDLFGTLLIEK